MSLTSVHVDFYVLNFLNCSMITVRVQCLHCVQKGVDIAYAEWVLNSFLQQPKPPFSIFITYVVHGGDILI